MNFLPNPLHPAVVHFPIVLLLLGVVAAVAAVFVRMHGVPALAATLLVMGAVGTWGAVESGESDGGLVENTAPQVNDLLDAHETWAKRTLTISIIAGLAAVGSMLAARWPRTARAVAVVAALVSVAAAYGVYETGHRGGALVYRHGAGIQVATTQPTPDQSAIRETKARDSD
ncbi:MAG TPA: DUF2231 domain-containing protein [Verrucomicrobiae bacterium]|nr:DUF2231 domain-containing protein [Verrucomicrobiae bacterium]